MLRAIIGDDHLERRFEIASETETKKDIEIEGLTL